MPVKICVDAPSESLPRHTISMFPVRIPTVPATRHQSVSPSPLQRSASRTVGDVLEVGARKELGVEAHRGEQRRLRRGVAKGICARRERRRLSDEQRWRATRTDLPADARYDAKLLPKQFVSER